MAINHAQPGQMRFISAGSAREEFITLPTLSPALARRIARRLGTNISRCVRDRFEISGLLARQFVWESVVKSEIYYFLTKIDENVIS